MLQSFPPVRLAALDLDGTLLNRNNEVTLATRQAIARAVEHGGLWRAPPPRHALQRGQWLDGWQG